MIAKSFVNLVANKDSNPRKSTLRSTANLTGIRPPNVKNNLNMSTRSGMG